MNIVSYTKKVILQKRYFGFKQFFNNLRADFGEYSIVKPGKISLCCIVPPHISKPTYCLSDETIDEINEPEIKNLKQIQKMKKSCRLAANVLQKASEYLKPGVSTEEIDQILHSFIISKNAYPSPLKYKLFPKSICTSVNNVACHGIPDNRKLIDGDIVNIDVTVFYEGFHGDCSKTFLIGNVDEKGRQLVKATRYVLNKAIQMCKPGVAFSAIGYKIELEANNLGFSVLPQFCGHGIGSYFHGPPDIYHCRNNYPGYMKAGMTFTIEPVLGQGTQEIEILDDNWTCVTIDNSRTAQEEHTILITKDGAEILTVHD